MKIKRKILLFVVSVLSLYTAEVKAAGGQITVARAFYELARQNNPQKIESLLDKGYSIESVDERGYNPVCLAVVKGDRASYNTLTSYGANKRPSCLDRIPESAYKRFFGVYPTKTVPSTPVFTSDTPYLIGAGILGAGAVVGAYLLRGKLDNDGDSPGPGPGPSPEDKCHNGTYNPQTKKCDCWSGFDNYGDDSNCYATINHCASQTKDKCNACETSYILKDNLCYAPINNCKVQDGGICIECFDGYGIYGGDGTFCYTNIVNCEDQLKDTCTRCSAGYGTYGDITRCYKTIENCMNQEKSACKQCKPGYSTYDNPLADYCYAENPCAAYPNTIPIRVISKPEPECVCNENKGYTGPKENCTQADPGDYQEGDGNTEEWNNLNEIYCHSHGKYDTVSGLCSCYIGYANSTNGCSGCAEGYLEFSGLCYQNMRCEARGAGYVQDKNRCVCEDGYFEYNMTCTPKVTCDIHYEQVAPGPDPAEACRCKPNFDENCQECISGYTYDPLNDICIQTDVQCEEKWQGSDCTICPSQFDITVGSDGKLHCGDKCAENRKPKSENDENCSICNDGYAYSAIDNTCVVTECTSGVDGYIVDEFGNCTCDTENGYAMSPQGKCVHKGDDYVGIKNSNINNNDITLQNDGTVDEFRDVYGMKPVIEDGEGNIEYYDSVYNAMTTSGPEEASISITNVNTGANSVYGIYSPSTLYNAAAIINDGVSDATAVGKIDILDSNTMSSVYGMLNNTVDSIYNAFARNSSMATAATPVTSTADGLITIKKEKVSMGDITGIAGNGNILNAYANTTEGIGADVAATGRIEMTHEGVGQVIGILGKSPTHKINNALAYLDSPVSNASASGEIVVSGVHNVYGMYSLGSMTNSETQFNKSFNRVENFHANGLIDATANSDKGVAYGMFLQNAGNNHVTIYNAMGYKSTGDIIARNTYGGSAYGIWNGVKLYDDVDEHGQPVTYYNNTYNAFRSSAKYGGNNVAATGTVDLELEGNSNSIQYATGLYIAGNVFNAYANSGSDVKLESIGNVIINDNSRTSNMILRGIESGGATIANAFATGQGMNTETEVKGNVEINILSSKQGSSLGAAAGIYSTEPVTQVAQIYNAALVNDKSNVEGNISVNASTSATFSRLYGIYATRNKDSSGDSDEGQEKVVYNAYYNNDDATVSDGSVTGTINVIASGRSAASTAEYYGIYMSEGTVYNTYSTNDNANVVGTIKVNVAGGENNGTAAGIYGYKSSLYNSGANALIETKTTRENSRAYGMKGDISYIENNGVITANSAKSDAYGIYLNQGQAVNDSNGIINVTGATGSYGIYAYSRNGETEVGSAEVINLGTINIAGETKNVGIYADGSNVTVENGGVININGEAKENVCEGSECDKDTAIQLVNGAHLVNSGTLSSSGNLNLSAMGGDITLEKGGQFNAGNSISGDINVSENVVKDTFATESVVADAVSAKDVSNLNLHSKSYLYDAELSENNDGKYDVVMQMKDFSAITDDSSEAAYLAQNYSEEKNIELFNTLKTASTASEADKITAKAMGSSMLPNIPEEELKVQRGLDRKMMGELFKDGGDVRRIVGGNVMHIGRDTHGTLTGYDLDSQSMYTLYDKKLDNRYRLGLGLSFTHTNTDYNDDSSRKNFMVQGYVPFTYNNGNGLTAVSMARVGYADGEYKRRGNDRTYEADTKAVTYGLLNEARYTKDMGLFNLTPFVGLNAIGWYQDSMNEGNDPMALHIDSENIFSLESALGIYVDKGVEFNQDNRLNVALGLGYYHEFADPYRGVDAHHTGNIGDFRIKNKLISRDRGILSAKVNYDYKDFSVYGEILQYLEEEHPVEIEGGIKYRF